MLYKKPRPGSWKANSSSEWILIYKNSFKRVFYQGHNHLLWNIYRMLTLKKYEHYIVLTKIFSKPFKTLAHFTN